MLYSKHGGHVLPGDADGAEEAAKKGDVIIAKQPLPIGTPFDYLLPELKDKPDSHLPGEPTQVVAALNALGTAMVDDGPTRPGDPAAPLNSSVPAIYTYWGQFLDHDLTANTDRDSETSDITRADLEPVDPDVVTEKLRNLRRPTLDLDTVYGDGPAFVNPQTADALLYVGPRLRVGTNHVDGIPGTLVPPEADLARDLPRFGSLIDAGVITAADVPEPIRSGPNMRTRAVVGDARNDENLLVAQFHTAVLRFHNAVVGQIEAHPHAFGLYGTVSDKAVFEKARRLTRWHYQWLVVNDYLKTVTLSGVVDKIVVGGPKHYRPLHGYELFMPLEYSVAAFRFGHSMVRGGYDHNRNFGKAVPGQAKPPLIGFASFDLLFQFTGNGFRLDPTDPSKSISDPFRGAPTLPFNWTIEFDRFTNKADTDETHFARKIDTRLAPQITRMVKEGNGAEIQDEVNKPLRLMLRHLARRNLLRGYLLSIPTGQSMAAQMGVPAMTAQELQKNNSEALNAALEAGGFLINTPLWYYLLKEAEVRANGNSLGELGSRIVCETVIGLLHGDRRSYLNVRNGWDPSAGVRLPNGDPIVTIRDFLSFTGVPA